MLSACQETRQADLAPDLVAFCLLLSVVLLAPVRFWGHSNSARPSGMADRGSNGSGNLSSGPEQPLQRVLYLGPDLSFSYAAAHAVFPNSHYEHVKIESFDEIFQKLEACASDSESDKPGTGQTNYDYAIVPVANSTNGPVLPVVDLLRRSGEGRLLQELAEHGVTNLEATNGIGTNDSAALYSEESIPMSTTNTDSPTYPSLTLLPPYIHHLPVHHYLYVHPSCPIPAIDPSANPPCEPNPTISSIIASLHTHPQVWTQCSRFLSSYFPDASPAESHAPAHDTANSAATTTKLPKAGPTLHNHASTSSAASYIASSSSSTTDPTQTFPAAICSLLAGQSLGLKCIAAHIEDDTQGNRTTFAVLGHRHRARQEPEPRGTNTA